MDPWAAKHASIANGEPSGSQTSYHLKSNLLEFHHSDNYERDLKLTLRRAVPVSQDTNGLSFGLSFPLGHIQEHVKISQCDLLLPMDRLLGGFDLL